jgi:hypothetical protein
MPRAEFEPVTPAIKLPQTYSLDRAAIGIGKYLHIASAFFVALYCFLPPFQKAIFCGVSSRAIVKVGCVIGKKGAEHLINLRYFHGICLEGLRKITKYKKSSSPGRESRDLPNTTHWLRRLVLGCYDLATYNYI